MNTISALTTLEVREAINIFLAVATAIMAGLYIRFILQNCCVMAPKFPWLKLRRDENREAVQAAIAWSTLSVGEAIRSTFVWEVLHFDRQNSTYASEIYPLMAALVLIVAGALCSIRVFSPAWMGHWLWIITLIVTAALVFINFAVLENHIFSVMGLRAMVRTF